MKRKKSAKKAPPKGRRKWSARVMRRSDALDLEPGAFNRKSPRAIASALKRSAEKSRRKKSDPFRSAMSMLNFFINRAGRKLPAAKKARLNRAKTELRRLFHRLG